MPIRVVCSSCKRGINAPEKYAGKSAKCPGCGASITIPMPEPVAAALDVNDLPSSARQDTPPAFTPPVSPPPITATPQSSPGRRDEQTLLEDSPDFVRGEIVAIIIAGFLFFAGLGILLVVPPLGVAMFVLGGLVLGVAHLRCTTTKLTVTTVRTVFRFGILSKTTREVRHSDVRLLEVSQSIIQRLLGLGTVKVASAAHGSIEIECRGLLHPERVRDVIDESRPH